MFWIQGSRWLVFMDVNGRLQFCTARVGSETLLGRFITYVSCGKPARVHTIWDLSIGHHSRTLMDGRIFVHPDPVSALPARRWLIVDARGSSKVGSI